MNLIDARNLATALIEQYLSSENYKFDFDSQSANL